MRNEKKYVIRRTVFALAVFLIIALIVLLLSKAIGGALADKKGNSPVIQSAIYEATEEAPRVDILLTETGKKEVEKGGSVRYETDINKIDFTVPGEYKLKTVFTYANGKAYSYTTKLKVRDTVPPTCTVLTKTITLGETLDPSAFISDVSEVVSAVFDKAPDWNKKGTQEITIMLSDMNGNRSLVKTTLTIE